MSYYDVKIFVETYTGLDKDALHIHAALLLYILAMVAFRRSRRSRFPWLLVLVMEIVNEAMDLRHQDATGATFYWREGLKDIWNTMLWPTVLLFTGRYTRLFEHRSRRGAREPEAGEMRKSLIE